MPVLIALSCVLVVLQPWLTSRLAMAERRREHGGVALFAGVFLAGVYGGYFGAAQGVLLIALLGLFLDEHLQRVNAAKNVLAGSSTSRGHAVHRVVQPKRVPGWPSS